MEKGFNQTEIDSVDQHLWRNERQKLYYRVKDFCQTNQITFTHSLDNKILTILNTEKIVYMQLFDLIPKYNDWKNINQMCETQGKVIFVLTDNVLDFADLEFVKFSSYPTLLGMTASYNDLEFKDHFNKLYNCFMQRCDSVRQSWFYFLHHYNLLEKGHVSFLLKQLSNYSTLTGKELFDYIHHEYRLFDLPHFDQAYYFLKDRVPFRNFKENNNLSYYILDSKYSLILETYACEDDINQWCFTEKLLRAMQFPNYVLPFCQKGSIGVLKSLGLEFNLDIDFIDQLPWQQRQHHLLQILVNDSVEYNQTLLEDVSLHNRNILKSWKTEYQNSGFFDDFYCRLTSY